MLTDFSLTGRTAIVVGGARGLCLEMMRALAEAGANVAVVDVLREQAEEAASHIAHTYPVHAIARTADVTDEQQIAQAFAAIEETLGPVDVLLSGAGIAHVEPAVEMSLADWKQMLDVNLTGMFVCARTAGRRMIARERGSIILIASMSGSIVNHPQQQTAYNVSKAGVIMLAKSLAAEWAPYHVRVNSISPGYIRTAMTAKVIEQDPVLYQAWNDRIPVGRMGTPAELRGLAVFLASDASSYMTGSDVIIDGGYTCW
jgi:NAD(P)-dependent dehydrogenase (short-subunit alcohol dehydrogenase family)